MNLNFLVLLLVGCSSDIGPLSDVGPGRDADDYRDAADARDASDADQAADAEGPDADSDISFPLTIGPEERPAELLPPFGELDGAPLAMLLHGYGPSENSYAFLVEVGERLRGEGFFVIIPDGTPDSNGYRFWNAGEACCDLEGIGVDDVAYLGTLLSEATSIGPIDRSRVFIFGHSNGGLMAYRMACEADDLLTAIASLAGPDPSPEGTCIPARPPSVLHIHGDNDTAVLYEGGPLDNGVLLIGAEESLQRWARYGGCDLDGMTSVGERDYEATIEGDETLVSAYREGCVDGATFELWRIRGGGHRPEVTEAFFTDLPIWFLENSR